MFLFSKMGYKFENTLLFTTTRLDYELINQFPNYLIIDDSELKSYFNSLGNISKFIFKSGLDFKKYNVVNNFITENASGCDVFGHDHLLISSFFFLRKKKLIEDGHGNYIKRKFGLLQKLCPFYKTHGYSPMVGEIYLTGILSVPNEILKKIKNINVNSLNDGKDFEKYIKIPKNINADSLVITQPFFNDGYLSETEHISLFKNVIKRIEGTIIIKAHPRDKVDYGDFNCHVVNKNIPIELVVSNSPQLKFIYIINSTSMYTIKLLSSNVIINYLTKDVISEKFLKDCINSELVFKEL